MLKQLRREVQESLLDQAYEGSWYIVSIDVEDLIFHVMPGFVTDIKNEVQGAVYQGAVKL